MGRGGGPIGRRAIRIALSAGGLAVLTAGGGVAWHWLAHPHSAGELRRLVAAHDSDAALRLAADLLGRNPADPQVLESLDALYAALCDDATGEPDRPHATAVLRRITITLHNAIRNGAEPPLGDEVLGKFALASGYYEMAATALRHAAAQGVPAERVDAPLALALLRAGRYQDVLQATPPDARSTPRYRAILLTLQARAWLGLLQVEPARKSLAAALTIDPANADALSRAGMLALWQDRDASAASALLARAQAASPDGLPALRLAGEYAYATGDYRRSAAAYAALVRRGAAEVFDPIPASLGLARALIYAGDLLAAQAALDASPLPAHDLSMRYYRALLAYRGGQFQRAAELAQSLDAAWPNYKPLQLLLGGALLASGLPAMAEARLAHYVAEVPGDAAARSLLQKAQRGMTDPAAASVTPDELMAAFGFPVSAAAGSAGKDGL